MRSDLASVDLERAPLRRRSRARAAFNLFVLPLLAAAGLFWLVGPAGIRR